MNPPTASTTATIPLVQLLKQGYEIIKNYPGLPEFKENLRKLIEYMEDTGLVNDEITEINTVPRDSRLENILQATFSQADHRFVYNLHAYPHAMTLFSYMIKNFDQELIYLMSNTPNEAENIVTVQNIIKTLVNKNTDILRSNASTRIVDPDRVIALKLKREKNSSVFNTGSASRQSVSAARSWHNNNMSAAPREPASLLGSWHDPNRFSQTGTAFSQTPAAGSLDQMPFSQPFPISNNTRNIIRETDIMLQTLPNVNAAEVNFDANKANSILRSLGNNIEIAGFIHCKDGLFMLLENGMGYSAIQVAEKAHQVGNMYNLWAGEETVDLKLLYDLNPSLFKPIKNQELQFNLEKCVFLDQDEKLYHSIPPFQLNEMVKKNKNRLCPDLEQDFLKFK